MSNLLLLKSIHNVSSDKYYKIWNLQTNLNLKSSLKTWRAKYYDLTQCINHSKHRHKLFIEVVDFVASLI